MGARGEETVGGGSRVQPRSGLPARRHPPPGVELRGQCATEDRGRDVPDVHHEHSTRELTAASPAIRLRRRIGWPPTSRTHPIATASLIMSEVATAIERVMTAGAYVWLDGKTPFMVGPTPDGNRLAVVRLGGHREDGESPWQCAAREVWEEAGITVVPVPPPASHWLSPIDNLGTLQPGMWPSKPGVDVAPVLVVENHQLPSCPLSVMYLARAESPPTPTGEISALLLLRARDIQRIVQGELTLDDYLALGGQAIMRVPQPHHLLLEPFLQLRVLARLLETYPDLPDRCHLAD